MKHTSYQTICQEVDTLLCKPWVKVKRSPVFPEGRFYNHCYAWMATTADHENALQNLVGLAKRGALPRILELCAQLGELWLADPKNSNHGLRDFVQDRVSTLRPSVTP